MRSYRLCHSFSLHFNPEEFHEMAPIVRRLQNVGKIFYERERDKEDKDAVVHDKSVVSI